MGDPSDWTDGIYHLDEKWDVHTHRHHMKMFTRLLKTNEPQTKMSVIKLAWGLVYVQVHVCMWVLVYKVSVGSCV